MNTKDELRKMCEGIVDDLEKVCEGEYWTEEERKEREEDCKDCFMWGYLVDEDSAYDIEFTVGSNMEYRAVSFMVACGSPNVWIDTRRGTVRGTWGLDSVEVDIPLYVCNEIDEVGEMLFAS